MPITIKGEEYLTSQETQDYLGISHQTLNNMVRDGRLNKYRQGFSRSVYYKKTELDDLRNMQRIEDKE